MIIALSLLSAPAYAADLNVPVPYATIDLALLAASDGDRIVLAADTYCVDIFTDLEVDFVGAGIDATIIDAGCAPGQSDRTFESDAAINSLTDLTIDGGGEGRVLDILGDVVLTRVRIRGANSDFRGGGMRLRGGNATLTDVVFRDNYSDDDGGGIAVDDGGYVSVVRSTFCNNEAWDWGGGLFLAEADADVTETVFVRNRANAGGAVATWDNYGTRPQLDLRNNTFVGNDGAAAGAAIYAWSTDEWFYNNIVAYNTSSGATFLVGGSGSNNLFFSNGSGNGDTLNSPVFGNPAFVANGTNCDDYDLHLQAGSPAIDAGHPAQGVFNDIGAFEYIADGDGDGQSIAAGDCDDTNPDIYTGAPELCNGIDDDCDKLIDDADGSLTDGTTYYVDGDNDGYGQGAGDDFCAQPKGYATTDDDCNDSDDTIHPGAGDATCDGVDDDCDGVDDDEATFVDYWRDGDSDGYGDPSSLVNACSNPGAEYVQDDQDCNDARDDVNPAAIEVCNGRDDDCDGDVDDDDNGVMGQSTWFHDSDGDSYGDPLDSTVSCDAPNNHVLDSQDCDDSDVSINPDGTEVCAPGDEDCDGLEGDADPSVVDQGSWFADNDTDGWGGAPLPDSCVMPGGATDQGGDCIDTDATVNPDQTEVCNSRDDDCDGLIDVDDPDVTGLVTVYPDGDGDDYGDGAATQVCTPAADEALVDGDCDDDDPTINPGEPEQCDNVDHDCDGATDNDITDLDWYPDSDLDGYGEAGSAVAVVDCENPGPGYELSADDCDDADDTIHPNAVDDTCDGIDQDCDGTADDGAPDNPDNELYSDSDGDGYGIDGLIGFGCPQPGLTGQPGDCDDARYEVSPAAAEVCNGIDDDCDGDIDEGCGGDTGTDTGTDTGLPTDTSTTDTGTPTPTDPTPTDTDTPSTGTNGDGGPVVAGGQAAAEGCSCSTPSSSGAPGMLTGLALLLGWRRRSAGAARTE